MKTIYKNRLPHIAPIGATFFVTYRLADALPQTRLKALKNELVATIKSIESANSPDSALLIQAAKKRNFGKYDYQLDVNPYGECYLQQPNIARLVKESLERWDGKYYDLQAYCIMPNHVHILINTSLQLTDAAIRANLAEEYVQLDKIMKSIKGSSARYINLDLRRTGIPLWQKDSYDHFVRNSKEWHRIVKYIINNPVKAGLAERWEDWPYTFCKYLF